jgi:nickel-dependent lactate racemase
LRDPIGSAPLAELIKPGDSVVVVHTDITRATPNDRILPVLLDELQKAGIAQENITLLNGLGTHRQQTEAELRTMLGDQIVEGYRCLQHDCNDEANLVSLGETSLGHPVRINRFYLEADVRILTGFIEPHFFAGFSGGPKAVIPSLAGAESVFTNHGIEMIAHPKATWGVIEGNPIWEEMCEVALHTHPAFLLNVSLNVNREITGIFTGEMLSAFRKGCAFVKENAMCAVDKPYDIVITTNSGYPLDQNLYQSVKGMSAANQIVRQGGSILIAVACEDGLPDHGQYAALLAKAGSPQGLAFVPRISGKCRFRLRSNGGPTCTFTVTALPTSRSNGHCSFPAATSSKPSGNYWKNMVLRHVSVSFPKDRKRSPICEEKYEQ